MNTIDQKKSMMLKKFHTLCSINHIDSDQKSEIINSYGCNSSKDMNADELESACNFVINMVQKENSLLDKWRKRVIASIGGYLKMTGSECNIQIIKGTAQKATGYAEFNKIPKERLVNVYNAFINKQKDFKRVDGLCHDDLITKSILN